VIGAAPRERSSWRIRAVVVAAVGAIVLIAGAGVVAPAPVARAGGVTYNIPPPTQTPPAGGKLSDHASGALAGAGAAVLGGGLAALVGGLTLVGTVATAPVWIPATLIVGGAAMVVAGGYALWYAGTHSPADRDYETIAAPVSIPAIDLRPPPGAPASEYVAAGNLLTDAFRIGALARAFWSSEDRAHGAADARSRSWYEAQLRAAVSYASASRQLFAALPALQSRIASAVLAARGAVTITGSQLGGAPTRAQTGVDVTDAFARLGVGSDAHRIGLIGVVAQQTRLTFPALFRFPQILTSQSFVSQEQEAIAALQTYAAVARRQEKLSIG
jgi:hypothetical protein